MDEERAEFETPAPDETVSMRRVADLGIRLYLLATEQPGLFAQAEVAVACVERRAPDLERRAEAALEQVLGDLNVDPKAIATAIACEGVIASIVDGRDVVRFVSGLGCHRLPHVPSAYVHQHIGMLALHMRSFAYESAVLRARRTPRQSVEIHDDGWLHTATAGHELTLCLSTRR